jgi:hypothetical protein
LLLFLEVTEAEKVENRESRNNLPDKPAGFWIFEIAARGSQ